jgi:hypothetical protein
MLDFSQNNGRELNIVILASDAWDVYMSFGGGHSGARMLGICLFGCWDIG